MIPDDVYQKIAEESKKDVWDEALEHAKQLVAMNQSLAPEALAALRAAAQDKSVRNSEQLAKLLDRWLEGDVGTDKVLEALSGNNGGALKMTAGKLRWELVPWEAMIQVVKVYMMGANKYGDHNWRKGIKKGVVFAALLRHAIKWFLGQEVDEESGLPHMAHAAFWCLAACTPGVIKEDSDDDMA